MRGGVKPDFVASGGLPVKLESERFEPAHYFAIAVAREPAYSSGHHDSEFLAFRRRGQSRSALALPLRLVQSAGNVTRDL